MHPEFEPRYTHDNYYEDMASQYEEFFGNGPQDDLGCTAHFCDLENLQKKELIEFQSKIVNSKNPYIFCSHAVEYICTIKETELFTDRIICLFTKPGGSNKLVDDRMRGRAWYNGERDDHTYLDISVSKLYELNNFIKYNCGKITKDQIFILDTDIFYSLEGYDYLVDIIKENLGIELPEICRNLHIQYMKYATALFGKVDK